MRRRKQSLVTRLLFLAVFGKDDLMHTLYKREAPKPGHSGVDTNTMRSKSMRRTEPDDVQVRLRGPRSEWQRPDPTKDEPTPLLRAQYLVRNWPKVYEMRLLYVHPPEIQA